jgi:hypothetical protein
MDEFGNLVNPHALVGHAAAAGPQRRVFISYASADAALAQKVCAALEATGILCWIAPRDVIPGTFYADAIVGAIDESSYANRPFEISGVYAFRGRSDEAFMWLDLAYTQRDPYLYSIKGEPTLKNLEVDPRYGAFLKKMNLPE